MFIKRDAQNRLLVIQGDTVLQDTAVLFAFLPLDMNSPSESLDVLGISFAEGEEAKTIPFADDGLGYDRFANDGVFTGLMPREQDTTQYYTVMMTGEMDGCEFVRKVDGTLSECGIIPFFLAGNADIDEPVCQNLALQFENQSIVFGEEMVTKVVWDFDDGTTSLEKAPEHQYAQAGTYFPSMTVYSNGGCSATFTDTVTVLEAPVAQLDNIPTDTLSCSPAVVFAMVDHPEPASGPLSYRWLRADATVWEQAGREVTLTEPGLYVGEVSNGQCTDYTDTVNLRFSELPTVQLLTEAGQTASEIAWCVDEPQSLEATGNFVTADWQIATGDEFVSVAMGPTYAPEVSGTYRVEVANQDGCTVPSSPIDVTVMPLLVANEIVVQTPGCYNGTLTLNAATSPSYETTTWFEADTEGPIGTGSTLEVTEAGNYYVRYDAAGACSVESGTVWANPRPTNISLSAPSGSFVCNEPVTFRVDMDHVLGAADELSWWYRDELGHQHHVFDAMNQLEYTTTEPGDYWVRLIFAAEGPNDMPNRMHIAICVQTDVVPVRIGDALPIPTVTALDDKQVTCQPDSVVLIAEPGFPNYVWNNGVEGDTLVLTEPMDQARAFRVSVSSQTCTSTSEAIGAYVKPGPVLNYPEIHGDTIYQRNCDFAVTRDISLGDTQVERYDWYYLTSSGDTVLSGIGAPFFRLNRFDSTLQVFCVVTHRESACSDTTGLFTLINAPKLVDPIYGDVIRPAVISLNPEVPNQDSIFIWGPNNGEDGLPEVEFFLQAYHAPD
ncbi:MAG: PKD domain-containing protein, partial [Bacteroidota bacterium]